MELGEPELRGVAEEIIEPLARRVDLEAEAGLGGDEGPPLRVLLHLQPAEIRAREHGDELILVESDSEMVDARDLPVARLDDDVDRPPLELAQPQPEAHPVELLPWHARLERRLLLADASVAAEEAEREPAEIPRLGLAHLARDEVVVEEPHRSRGILDWVTWTLVHRS